MDGLCTIMHDWLIMYDNYIKTSKEKKSRTFSAAQLDPVTMIDDFSNWYESSDQQKFSFSYRNIDLDFDFDFEQGGWSSLWLWTGMVQSQDQEQRRLVFTLNSDGWSSLWTIPVQSQSQDQLIFLRLICFNRSNAKKF